MPADDVLDEVQGRLVRGSCRQQQLLGGRRDQTAAVADQDPVPVRFLPDLDLPPQVRDELFGVAASVESGHLGYRIRSIIEPAFRAATVRPYADRLIRPLANRLIDTFVQRGEVELISEFAEPLSVGTVKMVLGLGRRSDDEL